MELNEIAKAWIGMWRYEVEDPRHEAYDWVCNIEFDWSYNQPDKCIDLVLEILSLNPDEEAQSVLAAGPLEQVIANHGEKVIERIERLAKNSPEFANLLGGIWKNAMSDEVWERVLVVRDKTGWE